MFLFDSPSDATAPPAAQTPLANLNMFYFDMDHRPGFRHQKPALYLVADLFRAAYDGKREFVTDKPLACLSSKKRLYFSGYSFDQFDLDVLLYIARQMIRSRRGHVQIDMGALLHSLKRRNDKAGRNRVQNSLTRLSAGRIDIAGKRYHYMTRLIDRLLIDERKQSCLVEPNEDVCAALGKRLGQSLDPKDRLLLDRNGLANWLHGVLAVFRGGFSSPVDLIQTLCGSTAKSFDVELSNALDLLMNAHVASVTRIDDNRVCIGGPAACSGKIACGIFSEPVFS
ncbi:hypothetical protein [Desulfovibrio inopinatus]|uniref:hypothetical protein n=1 Tax=Desulfovibrio inopinatus TaxID=102109 RepID=UPI0003FE6FEA|nr:hypothetical protein [Desulfovibrio inopinatus]